MNITDFLEARIAEDEAAARHRDLVSFGAERRKFANEALRNPHDPARVLAECAAKRAIVEWSNICFTDSEALHALAAIYADHPDYQQEWAK